MFYVELITQQAAHLDKHISYLPKNIANGQNGNQISQNNVWIDGAGNVVNNNNGTVIPASQRNVAIANSGSAGSSRQPSQKNVQDKKLPGMDSSSSKEVEGAVDKSVENNGSAKVTSQVQCS